MKANDFYNDFEQAKLNYLDLYDVTVEEWKEIELLEFNDLQSKVKFTNVFAWNPETKWIAVYQMRTGEVDFYRIERVSSFY